MDEDGAAHKGLPEADASLTGSRAKGAGATQSFGTGDGRFQHGRAADHAPGSRHLTPKASVGGAQDGPTGHTPPADEMSSVRKSVLFLVVVALAYSAYLVISGQLDDFAQAMSNVRMGWVIAACLMYGVYYVLGVTAYAIAVAADEKSPVGIRDLMSVEAAGIFFSNLTPNGTGGAPAQIFRLTRAGLSVGGAGALQYTRFIIYEAAEGVFAALMLVPRLGYFLETYGNVMFVGTLLFAAKVVEVAALLAVCLLPGPVTRFGNVVLTWAVRRGWVHNPQRWRRLLNEQVVEFSAGFRAGAKDVRLMALTLLVTLVQLGCLYALPWFVLRAFGRTADIVTCLACGSMLELLTSAVPLPGGTGGAEGGFAFLFSAMFGDALVAGYVVWRAVEYVLPVLVAIPLLGLRSRGGSNVHGSIRRMRARAARLLGRMRTGMARVRGRLSRVVSRR